jgi:hypothetical protein
MYFLMSGSLLVPSERFVAAGVGTLYSSYHTLHNMVLVIWWHQSLFDY